MPDRGSSAPLRVAVCADNRTGVADAVVGSLQRRGYSVRRFGALGEGSPGHVSTPNAFAAAAAEQVAGTAVTAVLCTWTGAGAAIDAMTVPGVRAAYCTDAETARRARQWAGANVLALSLRLTSEIVMEEILDTWLSTEMDDDMPTVGVSMGNAVLDQVVRDDSAALAAVLEPVQHYDAVRGALLIDTLLVYCAEAFNRSRAARVLRVHANTVTYRLDKIRELSGLDHRLPEDLVVLSLGARLVGGRTWNTRARHVRA